MANHEHPCRYCHEDMRLMADVNHEEHCDKRPYYFRCHVKRCGKRTRKDLRRYVWPKGWQQCCQKHFDSIGAAQMRAARRRWKREPAYI